MKKLITLLLLVATFLCSCSSLDSIELTGEENKSTISRIEGDILYIANINSKSYHLSSCYIVENIKAENKYETKDLDFLLEREFKPCKRCLKADE